MYEARKVIVVASCDGCPFHGECKSWKELSGEQRVSLTLSNRYDKFILKGCPLPDGEDGAEPFSVL